MSSAQEMGQSFWQNFKQLIARFGFSPMGLFSLIVIAVLPVIPPFNQEHMLRWLITGAFIAAQSVAFDFTSGYINVVNFGFAALLGLGAYTSAVLANSKPSIIVQLGWSPWVTIWIGALMAGLAGLLLGALTLRLRGIFAAVMAWFFGIALMGLANNLTTITRGGLGMAPPRFLSSPANLPYFYIILLMLILIYVTLKLVTNSNIGLAFKAIAQNPDAAAASGINATRYRVFNFALSAFFAGLLGGFFAHYVASLTPQTLMHTSKTVEVLAIAYIGGRGSLWGGVALAFPFIFFIEYLRSNTSALPGLHLVIYGVLMILVMIFYPKGLAGMFDAARDKVMSWFSKPKATATGTSSKAERT